MSFHHTRLALYPAPRWRPIRRSIYLLGAYAMIDVGISFARVYRAADMRVVKQWRLEDPGDIPAHGFIDDHTAYQPNRGSRVSFQRW